jgi:hypothetical protein
MVEQEIILGHLVSIKGLEVDKAKIDIIFYLSYLISEREVHSFFGHTGFYQRFIKNY